MPVDRNTVNVEIYGFPMRALVDKEATVSCVAASILPKLGIDTDQVQSTNATNAVAVGGEEHRSLGALSLPVSFGSLILKHKLQVFEIFHQPLILGLDFLKSHAAIFDTAKTLFFSKTLSPIVSSLLMLTRV